MSEEKIDIETRLDAPDLDDRHSLQAVLHSALSHRAALPPVVGHEARWYWAAAHFKLDQVSLYRQASETEQFEVLRRCSQNVMAESYYIEKCGMYFAAKMGLLAQSAQERMLYSLFGAEEAVHFSWVKPFVSDEAAAQYLHNPFIQLLDQLLRREDRTTLTYVVQVLLEGWGLHHYLALARACVDEQLQNVFAAILKDEARHHASGLILINERSLSASETETLTNRLLPFFRMVQSGPQMIVAEIERLTGQLSEAQKIQIFEELDCERETAKRLDLLQSFIRATKSGEPILENLCRADRLRSFSPLECAQG